MNPCSIVDLLRGLTSGRPSRPSLRGGVEPVHGVIKRPFDMLGSIRVHHATFCRLKIMRFSFTYCDQVDSKEIAENWGRRLVGPFRSHRAENQETHLMIRTFLIIQVFPQNLEYYLTSFQRKSVLKQKCTNF